MQALVAALWRAHQPAVLLVTHDVDEALLLADRTIVLVDGIIKADFQVATDRPRHHGDPEFNRMRALLLEELGVGGLQGAELATDAARHVVQRRTDWPTTTSHATTPASGLTY